MTAIPDTTTRARPVTRLGDRVFRGSAVGSGVVILALLAGVAIFLIVKAIPALTASADEIPGDPRHAGIGYVIDATSRLPVRFRAAYVADNEIDELVDRCHPWARSGDVIDEPPEAA